MKRTIPESLRSAGPGRVKQATLATDSVVRVYDFRGGRPIDEVLLIEGASFRDPAPLCLDHEHAIRAMVGSASGFRREPGKLTATLRFASGTQAADEVFALVEGGHLRSLSIGYSVDESAEIPAGRTQMVAGKQYTAGAVPLRIVTRWTLREVSLVVIPADEGALIRSRSFDNGAINVTTLLDVIGPSYRSLRPVDLFRASLQNRGERPPESEAAIIQRAMSTTETVAELNALVNTAILSGFRQAADSTSGWARVVPLPNFLAARIAAVTTAPRLERLPPGGSAPLVGFGVTSEGWSLARFAAKFELDEQDMVDSPFDVFAIALEQIGVAARRLVPDLVYSTLLANAALADGVAIFDASRSNYVTTAFGTVGLDAGLAAVGNQLMGDVQDDPCHRGLSAKYVVVPPELLGAAKRAVRAMATGDGDLVVRAESRLSTGGVVNPLNETILTANGTNWLLSCSVDQAAAVAIGSLNGKMEPDIRDYALTGGRFGRGFDVLLDLACSVVTPEALYWSVGDES